MVLDLGKALLFRPVIHKFTFLSSCSLRIDIKDKGKCWSDSIVERNCVEEKWERKRPDKLNQVKSNESNKPIRRKQMFSPLFRNVLKCFFIKKRGLTQQFSAWMGESRSLIICSCYEKWIEFSWFSTIFDETGNWFWKLGPSVEKTEFSTIVWSLSMRKVARSSPRH